MMSFEPPHPDSSLTANARPTDLLSADSTDLTDYIYIGSFAGAGTFGRTLRGRWKGFDKQPGRLLQHTSPNVALKVIKLVARGTKAENDVQFNARFNKMKNRLQFLGKINHDNILPLLGIARIDADINLPALVLPWMEHGNVTDFLQRNPSFPTINFLRDIIQGLHYLHTLDPPIVHGDLRPANVLVNNRKQACLCDVDMIYIYTLWRDALVTPPQANNSWLYMAPELASGKERLPTAASDIFSFAQTCSGIMLSENSETDLHLRAGQLPTRRAIAVWDVIGRCRAQEAKDRPTTGIVLELLLTITESPETVEVIYRTAAEVTARITPFQNIPSVVILEILKYLEFYSILKCRLVCSGFKDLIDSSARLQYKIELATAGQRDGGRGPLFLRRQVLREHQERWTGLKWTGSLRVPMFDPGFFELRRGALAQAKGSPSGSHSIVHVKFLPSQSRGIRECEWTLDLGLKARDIGIDPGQDLLAAVECPRLQRNDDDDDDNDNDDNDNDNNDNDRYKIHLRTLSTGKPHPLASGILAPAEACTGEFYEVEICEDILCVLLFSDSHEHEVLAWNWKTGQLLMHITTPDGMSMTFLTESQLLIAAERSIGFDDKPCLTVVDLFSQPSEQQSLDSLQNDFIFVFPPAAEEYMDRIMVQSNPRQTLNSLSESLVPFSLEACDRLVFVQFIWEDEDEAYGFAMLASSLLSLIAIGSRHWVRQFDWHMWGPDTCRLLPMESGPELHFPAYGTRLAAIRVSEDSRRFVDVYDFNQLALRKQMQNDPASRQGTQQNMPEDDWRATEGVSLCVTEPTRFWMRDSVETRLSYRVTSRAIPENLDASTLLYVSCSEDAVIFVDKHDEEFHVLTI